MINEEFIATLDFLVAACLWPSIVDARSQTEYFSQRVSFYTHFDGKNGRRNWRSDLYGCLSAWEVQFPEVVRKRKSGLDLHAMDSEPGAEPGRAGRAPVPDGWI